MRTGGNASFRLVLHYNDHGWIGSANGAFEAAVYLARMGRLALAREEAAPLSTGSVEDDQAVMQQGYVYVAQMSRFTVHEAAIVGLPIPADIADEASFVQPSDMPDLNADGGYGIIARIYTIMELEAVGLWHPDMTVDVPGLRDMMAHPQVSVAALTPFAFTWGAHSGYATVSLRTGTFDLYQRTYNYCDPLAPYPCADDYHVTMRVDRVVGHTASGIVVRTTHTKVLPLGRRVRLTFVPRLGFLQVHMPGTTLDGQQYCNAHAAGGACGA